ncbi:hypothetical protein FRC18_011736 [Serendipita sp. 400]|nr:hypothetical protein FRC18_011736 [Serendipita sp. 400]
MLYDLDPRLVHWAEPAKWANNIWLPLSPNPNLTRQQLNYGYILVMQASSIVET